MHKECCNDRVGPTYSLLTHDRAEVAVRQAVRMSASVALVVNIVAFSCYKNFPAAIITSYPGEPRINANRSIHKFCVLLGQHGIHAQQGL